MIVDVPNASDFEKAGLDLLHLAWSSAIAKIGELRDATDVWAYNGDTDTDEGEHRKREAFWRSAQPSLANAVSLTQQAIELMLKGRIATVSPYLLIARDARDYPSGSDKQDTSFGTFRTIDAADLFKVNNAVSAQPLPDDFGRFWENLRRLRNVLMHSVGGPVVLPEQVILLVLEAYRFLFPGTRWASERLDYLAVDDVTDRSEWDLGIVVHEIADAVDLLKPAEAKAFMGVDKRRRFFLCPHCDDNVERNWQRENLPLLAQLVSRDAAKVWCCICDEISPVGRTACRDPDCKSTVISVAGRSEGDCLLCRQEQKAFDDPPE